MVALVIIQILQVTTILNPFILLGLSIAILILFLYAIYAYWKNNVQINTQKIKEIENNLNIKELWYSLDKRVTLLEHGGTSEGVPRKR